MFIVVILTFDGMFFLALSVSIGWLKGTRSVICPFFHGKIGISPAIHWEEWMFPGCVLIFLGKTNGNLSAGCFSRFSQHFPRFFASLDPASSAPSRIPRLESLQIAWTAFA
jgi:hypothetical protein